jgi:site-specific recombinase XerD
MAVVTSSTQGRSRPARSAIVHADHKDVKLTDVGLRRSAHCVHTLRHSAAVAWLEAGVHIKAVADLLGHSSISITGDIYQ